MTASLASAPPRMHPNKANFIEGLNLIFESWTAFKLAVQMEFAGEETHTKAAWFRSVLVEHFDAEGKNVEPEDLEDILLDVMAREFHICLEDGSEREIAKMLFDLYRECIRGERGMLDVLKKKAEIRATQYDPVAQSQASEFVLPVSEGEEGEDEEFEDDDEEDDEMEM